MTTGGSGGIAYKKSRRTHVGHIGIDLFCKHVSYDVARGLYVLTEADLRFLDWVRSEGYDAVNL